MIVFLQSIAMWILDQLGLGVDWIKQQANSISRGLRLASLVVMGLMPLGLIVGWVGFLMLTPEDSGRYDWITADYVMAIGEMIVVFAGLLAAFILTSEVYFRTVLLNFGAAVGMSAAAQVTKPLTHGRMNLSYVHGFTQAILIDRLIRSVLAAIVGAALYVAIFPVYVSPGLFFLALLIIFFLVFASAWLEGSFWIPLIKKLSVAIAGIILLLYIPLYAIAVKSAPDLLIVMQSYKNDWMIKSLTIKNSNDADYAAIAAGNQRLNNLSATRVELVKKYPDLSPEEKAQLAEINHKIEALGNREYLNPTPTPTPTPTPAASSSVIVVNPPQPQRPEVLYGLEVGKAYKYENDPKVYVFEKDGKLHWIASEAAYARYYGHSYNPNVHVSNYAPIYKMPAGIPASYFGANIY